MASSSRPKYPDISQRLRHNLRNNSKFKSALLDLHLALHDEEDITQPVPKEAYDNIVKIYEEGKHKGLKCLALFYYVIADAHYKYAQDSNTNEAFSQAKEMFSKSVQAGWKFSDEDKDVFFANQIAVFYSESCSTVEDRELFLRDVDKMIKSCNYAKGPSACICHFYKGMNLWKQSKPDEALTSFRTSLKMTANTPIAKLSQYLGQHQIYTQIGRCHHDMTHYKLAISMFDKVIAHYDQNDDKSLKEGLVAMYQRGLSLKMLGKLDEAYTALESFINFMETNRLATELRQTPEFEMYLTMARNLSSSLQIELRLPEKISTELKLRNKPDRLDRLSDATKVYTEGLRFYEKDRFAKALEAFQKCLEIKLEIFHGRLPSIDFGQIHSILGKTCAKLEMHQDAIEHLTMAEDCFHKSSTLSADKVLLISATKDLAIIYGKLNYDRESLHFWKKSADLSLVNMNDNLGMSYYNIARLLFRMRHYNESLKAYHKFLRTEKSEELETVTHKSLTCMAKCYLKVAKYKKALECVDRGLKYIQVRPSLQYWVHNFKDLKGRCLLAMDKPKEALNHLTEAKFESENWILAQLKKDKQLEISREAIQKSLPICRIAMYQFMCKKKLHGDTNHPDFNETFQRFCTDETDLKLLNDAFTFDNESDQELTRCYLDFFGSNIKNEQITSRFLSQHRNSIKLFHNSALISDFFRRGMHQQRTFIEINVKKYQIHQIVGHC